MHKVIAEKFIEYVSITGTVMVVLSFIFVGFKIISWFTRTSAPIFSHPWSFILCVFIVGAIAKFIAWLFGK